MAKTISDEQMKLSIIINGNEAQKQLFDLEKSTRKLTEENKSLGLQKALMIKQGKQETEEYKALTATMKANTAEINGNKTKMKELQNEIGITGLTMHQLTEKAKLLRMSLINAVPGSESYKKYTAELEQVTTRLSELKGKSSSAKSSISSLADGFNKYAALGASVVAGLTGIVLSVQKIIDINGKLSDAQADVMKTTNMTKKEVDDLTKSFGMLETRTSRIDLLGIAEQGGRIGIAKDEIGAFVDVMNKASVSLGDSFTGGAEEVANKLGKLKFLFKETKDLSIDKAYNSIGSAINDLGAYGIASEANIAEFATRLGSLTDVMKPTIQQTLALGAAFEESGVEAEISSRAYGIVLKEAATKSGKFAEVMRISKKEVEDLINTNPMEFMLKFSEGMKGMSGTDTAKTLKYLGIEANGAEKAIGAMGNNTARFRELINLSNNSFALGTSLIKEYNIKNETLGATLEKISKRISGAFSSETFTKWLGSAVTWFAEFIGATEGATQKVSTFRIGLAFTAKLFAVLIASLIGYSAATKIAALDTKTFGVASAWANLQSKLEVMWTTLKIAGLTIYTGVMNFFGIATTRATSALVAMNVASEATPWGAIIGLMVAVGAAYLAFRDSVNKAVVEQDSFSKQQKTLADEVGKSTEQTKAHLSSLVTVINDTNVSLESRKKAYDELVKIAPEFNGLIVKEGEKVMGLLTIYDAYIKALDAVAYAKGFNKLNEGNIQKEINLSQKLYDAEVKLANAKKENAAVVYNAPKASFGARDEDVSKYINESSIKKSGLEENQRLAEEELKLAKNNLSSQKEIVKNTNAFKVSTIKDLEASIKNDEGSLKKLKEKSAEYVALGIKIASDKIRLNTLIGASTVNPANPKSNFKVGPDEGSKSSNSSQAEINKLKLDEQLKYNDQTLKFLRQLEDDKIAAMQDGYEKEMLIEGNRYKRELEDLDHQKIHADELAKIDEEIAKAKESKDITKYNALLIIRKGWDVKNLALDNQIDAIKEGKLKLHNQKIGIIEEKAAKELLDDELKAFEQGKTNRETAFNNEIATLNLSDAQKKKRKEDFDKKEIEIQKEFLNKKIEELNKILSGEVINGIDFSLLSPDAKKEIQDDIILVQNAISKLNAATPDGGKELDLGLGGDKDILGFSQKHWRNFFTNLENGRIGVQTMTMALMMATEVFSKLDQYMSASENASLKKSENVADQKKAKLKKQLDNGIISQTQYNKKVEKIDKELDDQKTELEYKQAKRQKAIAIANVIMSTAQAIIGIWAQFPKGDYGIAAGIMTGVVGVMGALQLATIMETPLPAKGHEEGLYQDYVTREQDGKTFKSSYQGKTRSGLVSKTSHFLVAENGPEMVIDNKAWRQMNPEIKDALVRDLRGIHGYEKGLYQPSIQNYKEATPTQPTAGSPDTQLMQMVLSVVQENTAALKQLQEQGVVGKFFRNDLKSMKEVNLGLKDYTDLITKSKK